MKYINILEKMNIIRANRIAFINTVTQYCAENQSIRLTGPPIFFTKIIFDHLKEMYSDKIERKDGYIDI